MGLRKITKPELALWEKSYTNPLEDAKETRSCMLSLEEVNALGTYINEKNQENPPANIDGIQIYLTRSPECDDETKINTITTSKGNIYQISFAIVPLVGTEIFVDHDGLIMCLYPGLKDKSATGLCPPKCSK